MRLSAVQKELLLALLEIARRQSNGAPLGAIDLFTLLNQGRSRPIAVTDFRRSCQKLISTGLIEQCRDPQSLKLVLRISASGTIHAQALQNFLPKQPPFTP